MQSKVQFYNEPHDSLYSYTVLHNGSLISFTYFFLKHFIACAEERERER